MHALRLVEHVPYVFSAKLDVPKGAMVLLPFFSSTTGYEAERLLLIHF